MLALTNTGVVLQFDNAFRAADASASTVSCVPGQPNLLFRGRVYDRDGVRRKALHNISIDVMPDAVRQFESLSGIEA